MKKGKTLLLKLLPFVIFLLTFSSYSQTVVVSGEVYDDIGNPLPGVSVLVEGTTNGISTDFDGKYAINIKTPNAVLVFAYLGYETKKVIVSNQKKINVILKQSLDELEEIQIVAFSKQKKTSVIGSVTSMKVGDIKQPTSNITNALAGQISGLISYQRSGEPGADNAAFFIRGVTTFGFNNSPLILLDGLQITTDDLARLEPDNIASFSIMKDATATSLYGARGANGVVLVTTKEGKKGKAKVSVRYENSMSAPSQVNNFLGAVDYMELYNRAQRMRDPSATLLYSKEKIEGTRNGLNPNLYPDVNWHNELFKDFTMNRRFNANINGGGEVAQYYLSVTSAKETGLLRVDPLNNFNNNIDISRSNLRANININLTKTTKVSAKFYSLFERYNGPVVSATDIFYQVSQANPANFPKVYEADENTQSFNHTLFGNKGNGGFPNPYAESVRGFRDRFANTTLAQFQVNQDLKFITEGLKLRAMASVRTYTENQNERSFTPFFYGSSEVQTPTGVVNSLIQIQEGTEFLNNPTVNNNGNSNFYYEAVLEYNRTFNEKHAVSGLLVNYFQEALNTIGGNTAFSTLPSRNTGISGRASYSFDDRYFSEFNFGYNGSEKFAEENRFGFFPSVGFGWILSNEEFFEKNLPAVNLFKLRYSYGLVGNDGISSASDRFFYLSDVNLNNGGTGYSFGSNYNNYYNGFIINRYANESVSWEIATKSNIGIEFGLFNKLNVIADIFTENRRDIYMERQFIPETSGLTTVISSNIGEVRSNGIDLSVDYNHAFSGDFYITARGNFTYATNEVLINGEPEFQDQNLSRIGHPVNQQWGYIAERLFVDQEDINNSPEQFNGFSTTNSYLPGDIKYTDVNNDGVVNESDQVPIGRPNVPEIVYGFGFSAKYKNFDFSVFMQGVARTSFLINPNDISPFVNERNALSIIADNHWSENNPDPNAFWPRLATYAIDNNEKQSTWWLRSGDFLRLKNVELGYTLPESLGKVFSETQTRVYFTGVNLLHFSKFDLWDPEMAGNGLGYPPQRVFNLGVQVNF
ncbi:TonB-dependent receptor [Polaribacter litorisediminis]|uniref:SusC/RagA family TonB-linked outer membrane protein n=1 Tax=Polaribacter litorisediminis TaxID=1908341 RepID=UPI001CBB6533|nr:TonB-dependent receptor [Polaribacter litorisediminis]UAM97235.1 TonB-dependent receptor [Polaribacter litorisediminis]